MPKYKILLLAPSFSNKGGVALFGKLLAHNLSSDFHVDYLRVGTRPPGTKNFIKKIYRLVYTVYKLRAKLKTGSYDIIHINPSLEIYELFRSSLHLSILNRRGYEGRTVVFFHAWEINLAERIINHSFWKNIFRKVYKDVSVIFVLHNRAKEQLANMGIAPEKIKVTKTMYERTDEIEECSSQDRCKTVNILFMSRFVKGKGVLIVAQVAKLLAENGYNDFHFIFAGDGPLLPKLKQFMTKNGLNEYVDTPGYVRGKEKAEILRKSDIFLFPPWLPEGCPVALMEAMGSGLAVVSTPRGAIPEVIVDHENGFIFDSQDPNVFYEAVKKLLDNRELLNKIQKANKKKAEDNYEAGNYTRNMEKVYLSIIERNLV